MVKNARLINPFWDDEIKLYIPVLKKQVQGEANVNRQLANAICVMTGAAPAIKQALGACLREIAPEAAEMGVTKAPIDMRKYFLEIEEIGGGRHGHS